MIKDLKNQRFGKLLVIEYNGNGKWLCLCDCGNKTIVRSDYLKTGHTQSCGCIHKKYGGNVRTGYIVYTEALFKERQH